MSAVWIREHPFLRGSFLPLFHVVLIELSIMVSEVHFLPSPLLLPPIPGLANHIILSPCPTVVGSGRGT